MTDVMPVDASPAAEPGSEWPIYRGDGQPDGADRMARLPAPPPWRRFDGALVPGIDEGLDLDVVGLRPGATERARSYRPSPDVVSMVNAALYLRRPLLVTGRPGNGKSSLAYSVAYELRLGPVLHWPITSRSTLTEALYHYDAIGRLHDTNDRRVADSAHSGVQYPNGQPVAGVDIGRYVRLGPLGTALLPRDRPRVLLIDEFDKSDMDLANDLLHVFEEGRFDIPELVRLPDEQQTVTVMTADRGIGACVERGQIGCRAFPFVVITSNAEREFPSAFLRRCLRYTFQQPDAAALARIVAAQLGPAVVERCQPLIDKFVHLQKTSEVTTDQLLNACHMVVVGTRPEVLDELERRLLDPIGSRVGP